MYWYNTNIISISIQYLYDTNRVLILEFLEMGESLTRLKIFWRSCWIWIHPRDILQLNFIAFCKTRSLSGESHLLLYSSCCVLTYSLCTHSVTVYSLSHCILTQLLYIHPVTVYLLYTHSVTILTQLLYTHLVTVYSPSHCILSNF